MTESAWWMIKYEKAALTPAIIIRADLEDAMLQLLQDKDIMIRMTASQIVAALGKDGIGFEAFDDKREVSGTKSCALSHLHFP